MTESDCEKDEQCFGHIQHASETIMKKTSRKTIKTKPSNNRSIHFESYETFHDLVKLELKRDV